MLVLTDWPPTVRVAVVLIRAWRLAAALPDAFNGTLIRWLPTFTPRLTVVFSPAPPILTVPDFEVLTVTSSALPLALAFVILIVGFAAGQPVTAIFVVCVN